MLTHQDLRSEMREFGSSAQRRRFRLRYFEGGEHVIGVGFVDVAGGAFMAMQAALRNDLGFFRTRMRGSDRSAGASKGGCHGKGKASGKCAGSLSTFKLQRNSVAARLAGGERRGRESNPLVEVLQTPAFPLGYPAALLCGLIVKSSGAVNGQSATTKMRPRSVPGRGEWVRERRYCLRSDRAKRRGCCQK